MGTIRVQTASKRHQLEPQTGGRGTKTSKLSAFFLRKAIYWLFTISSRWRRSILARPAKQSWIEFNLLTSRINFADPPSLNHHKKSYSGNNSHPKAWLKELMWIVSLGWLGNNLHPKTERIPLEKSDLLTFYDTVEVEAINSCKANWAQIEGYS